MPSFEYIALSPSGERVSGVMPAASEQALIADLEARSLTPVTLRLKRERTRLRRGVSVRKLGETYAQLADLLHAGVPLLRALRLLGRRRSQPALARVFDDLAEQVSQGGELAEAMSVHPDFFDPVHIAMIRAGEKGGFLEQVLDRLSQFVTAQAEIRSKILASLIYPSVLVCVGTIVLGVIFAFGVPMFRPLFDQIEGGLPTVTLVVLGISASVRDYGAITLAVLVACAFVLWRLAGRDDVRRALTIARTRAPVIGPLTRAIAAARFCRMLGTLLANGVPMIASMTIAKDAAGNVLLEEAIEQATEAVRAGESLAPPLEASGLFADDVIEMISVGEDANNLDEVLVKIAQTIEQRIDRLLSSAVKLIEPLLLTLIAGVILLVAAGLILPMTRLSAGM